MTEIYLNDCINTDSKQCLTQTVQLNINGRAKRWLNTKVTVVADVRTQHFCQIYKNNRVLNLCWNEGPNWPVLLEDFFWHLKIIKFFSNKIITFSNKYLTNLPLLPFFRPKYGACSSPSFAKAYAICKHAQKSD